MGMWICIEVEVVDVYVKWLGDTKHEVHLYALVLVSKETMVLSPVGVVSTSVEVVRSEFVSVGMVVELGKVVELGYKVLALWAVVVVVA